MTAAASSGPEEAQYEEVPYVLVYATVSSTLLVSLLMAFQSALSKAVILGLQCLLETIVLLYEGG